MDCIMEKKAWDSGGKFDMREVEGRWEGIEKEIEMRGEKKFMIHSMIHSNVRGLVTELSLRKKYSFIPSTTQITVSMIFIYTLIIWRLPTTLLSQSMEYKGKLMTGLIEAQSFLGIMQVYLTLKLRLTLYDVRKVTTVDIMFY